MSCAEHRDTLRLLALKKKLMNEDLEPGERSHLERETAEIEKKLKMD